MPDPTPLPLLHSLQLKGWSQVLHSGESLSLQTFSVSNVQSSSSVHAKTCHLREHLHFCMTHPHR